MDILKSAIDLMSSQKEDPKKPKYPKRVVVFAERPNMQYPPSDPGERARSLEQSNAFITEAQKLVNFYKRVSPSTKVEILPVYETGDNKTKQKIQDTLYGLTPDDDVMVFGHHGSKYAGIPTQQWASLLEGSNYGNCYLGSCGTEDVASGAWKNVKNLIYRPSSQWLGVNQNAKNIIDAMFSTKANTAFELGLATGSARDFPAEIVKPVKGEQYEVKPNPISGSYTTPFSFSNPSDYYLRATGLPFSLRPPKPTAKKVNTNNVKKVQSTLSNKKKK
jgi:hypothetical protein